MFNKDFIIHKKRIISYDDIFNLAGVSGDNYGGGGSGAANIRRTTGVAGGAGAAGLIIVIST